MFDTGTNHLSATYGQVKVFLGLCGWKKSNLQIIFMYIHFSNCANTPKCIVDTADIWKTLDVFYISFFGQWFVEIKLKKLSILTCKFVNNFVARYWYKMVATPCSRHGLWLCKAILQHEHQPFLPGLHQKMWWKEFLLHVVMKGFSFTYRSKHWLVGVFVNCVLQPNN